MTAITAAATTNNNNGDLHLVTYHVHFPFLSELYTASVFLGVGYYGLFSYCLHGNRNMFLI